VQVDALTVDLLAPCVRIHLTGGLTKLVSYLDFIELLRLNLDIKDGSKDAGQELFLPNGTFYLSKDDQTIRICTYHPECIQPVNYRGTVRQSTVPNIIISMVLSRYADGYRVTESRYFATKSPLGAIPRHFISRSSGFSILPFTNVYEDGRLCFGSSIKISSFQLPDLRGLHSFYQVLFDAPFNDDLGLSALKTRFRRATYNEWYAYLAKQAKDGKGFPYEELEINS